MIITKDDGGDDHYCRGSRLRLRASSIIDDIASWWTVAPLALLTIIIIMILIIIIIMTVMMTHLNINHDFVITIITITWPPTCCPFLSVRVEHHGLVTPLADTSASTNMHLVYF